MVGALLGGETVLVDKAANRITPREAIKIDDSGSS